MTPDPWLSEVMGSAVWSVAGPGEGTPHGPAMLQARVPAADVETARALCAEGFYPVDMALTLRRDAGAGPPPALPVRPARADERDAVGDLSGRAMTTSRFSLDPGIPEAVAGRVKREWASNCVAGLRGVGVTVVEREGQLAGFLAALDAGGVRVIDLVAVDPAHQGRGVGRALVADFLMRHGPSADGLAVTTQASNGPSLALYESMGFRLSGAAWALHRHIAS